MSFFALNDRYFSRTATGEVMSMLWIWFIAAVRALAAERRAVSRARIASTSSVLGIVRACPESTTRAAW